MTQTRTLGRRKLFTGLLASPLLLATPNSIVVFGSNTGRAHAFWPEAGPWGHLTISPIVVSPPLEYVPIDDSRPAPPRWHFARMTVERLEGVLHEAGFSDAEVAQLRGWARPDAEGGAVTVRPTPAFVRAMSPDVRARLYLYLSQNPLNFDQQSAYRFYGDSVDDWLGDRLQPKTRALVQPLVYRTGGFLFFADIELIRDDLGSAPELQRLIKRLLRQATMLVSLRVDDSAQVESLVEYWGRGGRRTDIRPLLESMAEAAPDHSIDITHLLPELPRRLLYRYPKVSQQDLQKPQLANCFWTALNFFNGEPDDRLLDPKVALRRLQEDYFLVHGQLQLGDIVAVSDSRQNIFHVAVHVADDLVFTKNGFFSLTPWTILPMERLKGHFMEHLHDWNVTYYRRKDL